MLQLALLCKRQGKWCKTSYFQISRALPLKKDPGNMELKRIFKEEESDITNDPVLRHPTVSGMGLSHLGGLLKLKPVNQYPLHIPQTALIPEAHLLPLGQVTRIERTI